MKGGAEMRKYESLYGAMDDRHKAEIRRLYAAGWTQVRLARHIGTSQATMRRILIRIDGIELRRTWARP